jgi:GNAT superfamily N-acetyltransferase
MGTTRKATAKDLSVILLLLKELHGESILKNAKIDEGKLHSFIAQCVQDVNKVCLVYQSTNSIIEGLLLGYTAEYFFSTEKGAWDLVFYVRPERRGGLVAYRLWSEFKAWATASGASTLWLGTAAGIDPFRSRRFYLGLGMEEVGGIFRMNLGRSKE